MLGPKVLIIEDERLIAESLRMTLEDKGYRVTAIASSAEEALTQAGIQRPDVLLIDIRISGELDGVETAKMIRENVSSSIGLLFLSAYPRENFPHIQELKSESLCYLQKPYSPDDLVSALKRLVPRSSGN
jgi:DNA-binding response OmpR family regulator